MGIISYAIIRIPSLNNQDSMESKAGFFSWLRWIKIRIKMKSLKTVDLPMRIFQKGMHNLLHAKNTSLLAWYFCYIHTFAMKMSTNEQSRTASEMPTFFWRIAVPEFRLQTLTTCGSYFLVSSWLSRDGKSTG